MTENSTPKVGDKITTYEEARRLPPGTRLRYVDQFRRTAGERVVAVRDDGEMKFMVAREMDLVALNVWRIASGRIPFDYEIVSLPEGKAAAPFKVGDKITTAFYRAEELSKLIGTQLETIDVVRSLPVGTKVKFVPDGLERTLEADPNYEGEVQFVDSDGRVQFWSHGMVDYDVKSIDYVIVSIPGVGPEPEPEPETLESFKVKVRETVTRYAEYNNLCNVTDDFLEELGLEARDRKRKVTITLEVDAELARHADPRVWDEEQLARNVGRMVAAAAQGAKGDPYVLIRGAAVVPPASEY